MRFQIVAKYSFLEALKSRLLINTIFLGVGMLVATYIASELSYGKPDKIAIDIGLGLISIALKVIAVFYGVGIIQSEIDSRSIYLILSRPISRAQYFLGRILGMASMLGLNLLILGPFSILLFSILGGEIQGILFWTLFFMYVESVILLLFVVVSSLFASKVFAILFSISVYISRFVTDSLLDSNQLQDAVVMRKILEVVQFLFPNFSKLNLKDLVLYQETITHSYAVTTLAHSILYMLALVLVGIVLIGRKDFD